MKRKVKSIIATLITGGLVCIGCNRSSPAPRSATPATSLHLPEYYGMYAIADGKTMDVRTGQSADELPPGVEFLIYDKSVTLGASNFVLRRLPLKPPPPFDPEKLTHNADGNFSWDGWFQMTQVEAPKRLVGGPPDGSVVIETRVKPVADHNEMLQIVPAQPLPPGLYEINGVARFWTARGAALDEQDRGVDSNLAKKDYIAAAGCALALKAHRPDDRSSAAIERVYQTSRDAAFATLGAHQWAEAKAAMTAALFMHDEGNLRSLLQELPAEQTAADADAATAAGRFADAETILSRFNGSDSTSRSVLDRARFKIAAAQARAARDAQHWDDAADNAQKALSFIQSDAGMQAIVAEARDHRRSATLAALRLQIARANSGQVASAGSAAPWNAAINAIDRVAQNDPDDAELKTLRQSAVEGLRRISVRACLAKAQQAQARGDFDAALAALNDSTITPADTDVADTQAAIRNAIRTDAHYYGKQFRPLLTLPAKSVRALVGSKDGRLLLAEQRNGVSLIDPIRGRVMATINFTLDSAIGESEISQLCVADDASRIVAGFTQARHVAIFDGKTAQPICAITNAKLLSVSGSGRRLAVYDDRIKSCRIIDVPGDHATQVCAIPVDGDSMYVLSHDGKLVARFSEPHRELQLIDAGSGKFVRGIKLSQKPLAILFNADGTKLLLVASGMVENGELYDVASGNQLSRYGVGSEFNTPPDFSVFVRNDYADIFDPQRVVHWPLEQGRVQDSAISPDGRNVWTLRDEIITLFGVPGVATQVRPIRTTAPAAGNLIETACPAAEPATVGYGGKLLAFFAGGKMVDLRRPGDGSNVAHDSTAEVVRAGVDLFAPLGSDVYAAADGSVVNVVASKDDPAFAEVGYAVMVKQSAMINARNTFCLYANLTEPPRVAVGQSVAGGQTPLGYVGQCLAFSAAHLHLELRHFPQWVNAAAALYPRTDSSAAPGDWEDPRKLGAIERVEPIRVSYTPAAAPPGETGRTANAGGADANGDKTVELFPGLTLTTKHTHR